MNALLDATSIKLVLSAMLLAALAALAALATGCSEVQVRDKYTVPSGETAVSIRAEDIGLPADSKREAGSVVLATEAPSGRFPTGLAVIRIDAFTTEQGSERSLRLTEIETHRAIYWNHLLDDLPAIREVVFPRTLGLDPRGYNMEEILQAAAQQNCGLCLIYAKVSDTTSDAEYVGGLWDTEKREPLAAFRAPATLGMCLKLQLEEAEGPMSIVREADFRAQQGFGRLIRDAIWDFAEQDTGSPDLQPSPWRNTDVPLFPRDYEKRRDPRYYPFWRGRGRGR